jgi:hypothetical protein
MLKSVWVRIAAIALFIAGATLLALPNQRAAAQSAGAYVSAVDLDIAPAETEKFLAALKENGAASVKEPGCQRFDIMVLASNPNHVFIYEVYNDAAASQALGPRTISRNMRRRPPRWLPSARSGR